MEWVDALDGTIVGLDTAPPLLHRRESETPAAPKYLPRLRAFFDAVDQGRFRVVTSILTLTEVPIHPLRQGHVRLADEYRRILLHARHVETVPLSAAIAEEAARLRAQHNLRTPDAIQLATAIASGATSFLTNDTQLDRQIIPNILVMDHLGAV